MKALLYNKDKVLILNRNSVTVGRQDCDIIIDDPRVESCHAVVEFNEEKQCFLIRDLNTNNGTYVNDCRVQNSAVFLTYGDVIRFGNGGKPFELRKGDNDHISIDSLNSSCRSSPNLPTTEHLSTYNLDSSLPNITRTKQKQFNIYPYPPVRPHSANERLQSIPIRSSTDSHKYPKTAWKHSAFDPVLQQRQSQALTMIDEIKTICEQEKESQKKDSVINGLRQEIMNLYEQLNNSQISSSNQLMTKLWSLEHDLQERHAEVEMLRQQLNTTITTTPTLTSQLANKEKSLHELRHDLDKSKQEFSMSQSLIQSLQRESISNKNYLKKKEIELNKLKQSAKDKDIQFQSLANKFTRLHDNKNKDEAIEGVNTELKTLKAKIRRLETRSTDHSSLIQRYKTELSQLNEIIKRQELEKAQWEKQKLEQKQQLLEIQRSERILRVDLEQSKSKSDRFRGNLSHVLYTATGLKAPDYPMHVQESKLLGDLEDLISTNKANITKLADAQREFDDLDKKLTEVTSSSEILVSTMEEITESLNEHGHQKQVLKNKIEILKALSVHDAVKPVQSAVLHMMESDLNWNLDIYQALSAAGYDIEVAEKRPSYFIHNLFEKFTNNVNRVNELEKEIGEMSTRHNDELHQVKQEMGNNADETMAIEIQKIRDEENDKRVKELEETKQKLEETHNEEIEKQMCNLNSLQQQLDSAKQEVVDKSTECEELTTKLTETESQLEDSKSEVVQLREEIKTVSLKGQSELLSLTDDRVLLKSQFDKEVKQYKEEIRQHSITIVAMEEKLQAVMKQLQNAQEEVRRMQKQTQQIKRDQETVASFPGINIDAYEQTIAMLRGELLAAQNQFHMQQDEMSSLRRELATNLAKLSDLKGELSEPQKEELEHDRRVIMEQDIEINKLQQKLLQMTELVSRQKEDIKRIKSEQKREQQTTVTKQVEIEKPSTSTSSMVEAIETKETGTQEDQAGKINSELTSQGALCRGERHDAIITRQREALAELRARIKALENAQPVVPNHEDLTQQVILLKKELAEIRAKQTMEDDVYFRDQLSFAHESKRTNVTGTPRSSSKQMEADVERGARIQLEEAIASSEQSYLDLANAVGGLLKINTLSGMRPMSHVPTDERMKVTDDRRTDVEAISTQIRSVLNRLERKDNLLQSYEKDLSKLREAEETAEKKSAKVSVLLDEITQKSEECSHLREALRRTEEKFHQEKRLNNAIKQKKTFYLENLDHRDLLPRHGACVNGDRNKSEKSKKKFQANMMKKEYEIQLLKQKLQEQERDLCRSAARIAINQQQPTRSVIKKSSSSSSSSASSVRQLDLE